MRHEDKCTCVRSAVPLPHGLGVRMDAMALILPFESGAVKLTMVRTPTNGELSHYLGR